MGSSQKRPLRTPFRCLFAFLISRAFNPIGMDGIEWPAIFRALPILLSTGERDYNAKGFKRATDYFYPIHTGVPTVIFGLFFFGLFF